jgi:hypothetical protein
LIQPEDSRLPAAADGFDELEVANASFFVEKLGGECGDLQGLRELTVNGIEAVAALGTHAAGRVIWDIDWERFDATGGRPRSCPSSIPGSG